MDFNVFTYFNDHEIPTPTQCEKKLKGKSYSQFLSEFLTHKTTINL